MEKDKYYGHPLFYEILEELKDLHNEKNYTYASEKDPLGNFKRSGQLAGKLFKPEINKTLAEAMCLMAKQIDAVYDIVGENKQNVCEDIRDKFRDIAVYSIICIIIQEEQSK